VVRFAAVDAKFGDTGVPDPGLPGAHRAANHPRRDRVTLATMVSIPLLQLIMFGYAINTMPRDLPTEVLLQESSDVGRSILAALRNTKFFKVTRQLRDKDELDAALASGAVLFAVEIPAGFERALRRGDMPALLVAADVNAVPPAGIEGLELFAKGSQLPGGALGVGPLAIGDVKYKTESRLFERMATSSKPLALDFRDAFALAREIV